MGLGGTVPECFGALFDYKVSYRWALELQVPSDTARRCSRDRC